MSAPRRFGTRAAVIGACCAALLTGACRAGRNPALDPLARSPRGVSLDVEWQVTTSAPRSDGELLGVDERGVYVLHRDALVLYPFGTPAVLRPERRPPDPLFLRVDNDAAVRVFSQYARYPFGMDEDLLERMLDALELDSVIVRQRP